MRVIIIGNEEDRKAIVRGAIGIAPDVIDRILRETRWAVGNFALGLGSPVGVPDTGQRQVEALIDLFRSAEWREWDDPVDPPF